MCPPVEGARSCRENPKRDKSGREAAFHAARPFSALLLLLRDLLALFACLGEADGDRLFAALHLAAFAAAPALRGALLVPAHLAFDVLAGALCVFPLLCFLRHWAFPWSECSASRSRIGGSSEPSANCAAVTRDGPVGSGGHAQLWRRRQPQ